MRRVAAAVTLLVLLLPAAPVSAEPALRIREIVPSGNRVQVVVAGSELGDQELAAKGVAVSLGGRDVPATAKPIGTAQVAVDRRVVLVIDTSGSMRGPGIAGAKQAASSFLSAVPPDVRVGLVGFSDTARLIVPITQDRMAVSNAVGRLVADGETALHDGVALGVKALGGAGVRGLVLLSDGADTSSTSSPQRTKSALRAAQIRVDAVAYRTDEGVQGVLDDYVAGSGGRVLQTADGAALATAFRAAARELATQLVVEFEVPPELASTQTKLRVAVAAGGQTLVDEVQTLLPAAAAAAPVEAAPAGPRPVAVSTGWLGSPGSLTAGLAAVFVALLVLLAVALGASGSKARGGVRSRRLLSLYTLAGRPAKVSQESTALGSSDVARSAVELAGRFAERRGFDERLLLKLDRAAVPLKAGEWVLVCAGCALAAAVLLGLLAGSGLAAVLGGIVGAVLPGAWLTFKAGRRRAAFLESMPDSLQLLSGSLSAGFSLTQGIDAVAREGSEPLAGEFSRAVAESRLGVPIEDALDSIADRMDSEDFRWVVMAVRVQREVGGNLAEVLNTVSQTMRDRAKLRRQVRALSAEGRLSAYVLIGLPISMTAYLFFFRRAYLEPLYTNALGVFMIIGALVLLLVGCFWMKKVVTVEV